MDEQPENEEPGHPASPDDHPVFAEAGEAEPPDREQPGESDATPAGGKRRTGLIVGVAAAVVVLAGGAGVGFMLVGGGSAQSAAEDYVALSMKETQDPRSVTADDYRPIVCKQAMPQIEQLQQVKEEFLKTAKPEDLEQLKTVQVSVKSVQENGDSGSATVESTFPGQPPQSSELKLVKEDGDWRLCV
ncbi:hypothetical protein AB0I53_17055 [Saccharopolyspora sp. NPDC050389]|uniref:Rv0361 family membrane protein n=1 Tax=Saccharopolyspora sp. NPDC050389 TaxID=3155516 RepID=UPI0033EBDBA3